MRFVNCELRKKDEFKIKKKSDILYGGRPSFVYSFPKNSALLKRNDDALYGWEEVLRYSWQEKVIEENPAKGKYYYKLHQLPLLGREKEKVIKNISEFFIKNPKYTYVVLVWDNKRTDNE